MAETKGWVKLHRIIIEKPIWKLSTPEQKSILITLLCMVNHDGEEWEWKGKKYKCKPGQKITSLDKIAKAAGKGITIQNVRTSLVRFEKLEFLTNESTKESRLVTVLNWDLYQSKEKDLTKHLTDDQQTPNRRLTTNKNDKNDKNERKEIYSGLISSFTENPELIKAINNFISMRKSIKSELTENALDLMLKKLSKLGKTDSERIEILNESVIGNWKGIFALKDKPIQHMPNVQIDSEERRKEQEELADRIFTKERAEREQLNTGNNEPVDISKAASGIFKKMEG